MEGLLELMRTRRSIRTYTGRPITQEQLDKVLQAGLLAPTGHNYKPWEFVVVRDKATLEAMSRCRTSGAGPLAKAACGIVVLGDEQVSDTIIEDCSIAMAYMQLVAHEQGLGSVWIQCRMRSAEGGKSAEEILRALLGYPEHVHVEAVLCLGCPESVPAPREALAPDCAKVHNERWRCE